MGFEDRSTAPVSTARQVQEDPVEFPDAEATGNNLRVRRGLCVELRDISFIACFNGEGTIENGPFSPIFQSFHSSNGEPAAHVSPPAGEKPPQGKDPHKSILLFSTFPRIGSIITLNDHSTTS